MCEKAKGYLGTLREYVREVTMVAGFGIALLVYNDFRDFTHELMTLQARTAEILSNIEVRIDHLDRRMNNLERDYTDKNRDK